MKYTINTARYYFFYRPKNFLLKNKFPVMFAGLAGAASFFLVGSTGLTAGFASILGFAGVRLIQFTGQKIRDLAAKEYLKIDSETLTDDTRLGFQRGVKASENTIDYLASFFDKNAILHPKAYYAGYEIAVRRDKATGIAKENFEDDINAICFMNGSNLIDLKEVAKFKEQPQESRNNQLRAKIAKCKALGIYETKFKQARSLLAAGADPNYVSETDKLSLIERAIDIGDLRYYNLLLKHNAVLFRDSELANKVLWEAMERGNQPATALDLDPNQNHIAIADSIASQLKTTKEAILSMDKSTTSFYDLSKNLEKDNNNKKSIR
ncbi:MAG: hypothetical protein JSS07_09080 [Proteobacteria bacterium]|nr:hypothetical protein [Pseudomonadota bacterium]